MGVAGLVLPAFLFPFSSRSSNEASAPQVLPIAGIVATCGFCSAFFASSQRQLLVFICASVKFVFLSLQVTAAHVCVTDFFPWDVQRVALATSSWHWIHRVLTLDALTPMVRQALGFRISYAIPVVVGFVTLQVGIVLELVW